MSVVIKNNTPAQISESLKIQLLHLLVTEPVADSPASEEGLHLHRAAAAAAPLDEPLRLNVQPAPSENTTASYDGGRSSECSSSPLT